MPITNAYPINGGIRQDFQKGHLTYVTATGNTTLGYYAPVGPGWTSSGWNNQYSYLFAMAFERNGGRATVGYPTGEVYDYGPYKRQDFSGGSFGDCCIMYDPDNATGNSAATNEAYLLRTGFYEYYFADGGYSAFGCPSRDEYATGDPDDAIQFFVRRVGGETQQHSMYYDASKPQGQRVSWHSNYSCDYVSQNPSGAFNMAQGESRTLTVQFRNTGTTTWYKNSGSYPYDYICLKSTDPSGNPAVSLLNSPYNSNLGWIDSQTPCTMNESSVSPGNVATFTFTGKVASDRQLGQMIVYFRPQHSTGELLPGWAGMNYDIQVISSTSFPSDYTLLPLSGDWDNDGIFEAGVYVVETHIFYLDTDNDSFTDQAISFGASGDTPLAGDWDGNGTFTIGIYRPSTRTFWLDYNNDGVADFSRLFGNSGDTPLAGDWDGNGTFTIGIYRPSTRTFWLDYNNDGVADFSRTYGDPGDLPVVGDWDGNGTTTIGVYRPSTRKFWLDYNNDGVPDLGRTFGDTGDKPVVGDWDGNSTVTIGVYRPATQYFWLDYDNNGAADRGFQIKKQPGLPKAEPSDELRPTTFLLAPNYPNPFNVQTAISYTLPQPSRVRIDIYNILGQNVTTLIDAPQEAGEHQIIWNAGDQPTGMYFYRLTTDTASETKKMLLLK
jgi:hypothetical protein